MWKWLLLVMVLAAGLTVSARIKTPPKSPDLVRVVKVVDGDTIRIEN